LPPARIDPLDERTSTGCARRCRLASRISFSKVRSRKVSAA
jgi:hypothetical protein